MVKPLKKILVVEDEPDIRAIIQIALEDLGCFSLKLCASGAEALKEAILFEPDLILLDVMMPEMDGEKVLLELRKIKSLETIPVIFMTAKQHTAEMHFFKLGVIDVIHKPFDPMNVADSIKKIWAEYNVTLLRQDYAEKLPSKTKALELAWQRLKKEWSEPNLIEFQRLAHNLGGSSATFGYLEFSLLAMQLEEYITSLLTAATTLGADKKFIEQLVTNINKIAYHLSD